MKHLTKVRLCAVSIVVLAIQSGVVYIDFNLLYQNLSVILLWIAGVFSSVLVKELINKSQ